MTAIKFLKEDNSLKDHKNKNSFSENSIFEINPLNAFILKDTGLSKIKESINNSNFSANKIVSEITNYINIHNQQELYLKFIEFIEQVGKHRSNKAWEILFYCHELIINSFSGFNQVLIIKIFDKLIAMLNSGYDSRAGEALLLILSCLRDLSIPSSISQQELNTCSVTCIQTQLAIREPLEYLNIIDALAQNKTYFSLKKQLINPDWSFLESKNDSRSISCKLIQNSIFLLCNTEKHLFSRLGINGGLTSNTTFKAYQMLFGDNFKLYKNFDYSPEQIVEILKSTKPSKSNPVQISIHYTDSGSHTLHAVNVIDFDNKLQDIRIINPWGREEIIDISILKSKIFFIISTSSCDKNIPRIPDKFFNTDLKSQKLPWYQFSFISKKMDINITNEKLNKYLNCLNLEQKIDLIISTYSFRLKKKDKFIILKILDNILQRSDCQNKTILNSLFLKLEAKDINLLILIDDLKMDNQLFELIVQKINQANRLWGNILNEILEGDFLELDY